MKINDQRVSKIKFGDLDEGDVFQAHDGILYMKLAEVVMGTTKAYNAVSLVSGLPEYCDDHLAVIAVDAEVVITEREEEDE